MLVAVSLLFLTNTKRGPGIFKLQPDWTDEGLIWSQEIAVHLLFPKNNLPIWSGKLLFFDLR